MSNERKRSRIRVSVSAGVVRAALPLATCHLPLLLCLLICSSALARPASDPEYLSPVEIKLSADGRRLFVVCEGNDSVLAVDAASQQVVARATVGHRPRGLTLSPDGKSLYVSNSWSDTVSEIDAASFQVKRTLPTGWGPVGLTLDHAGKTLYVANSIADSVSLIDLASGAEIKRFSTHRYPEQILLSPDGRRVYVANILPHLGPYDQPPVYELLVLDTAQQVVAERILIPGVIELRHLAAAPLRRGGYILVPFMRPKNLGPLVQVNQGWTLTHGMAVVYPELAAPAVGANSARPGSNAVRPYTISSKVTQVLLDDIDYYFAGNDGVAITPDGSQALVTSAEADVVSIIDTSKLARRLRQVPAQELPDRLDSALTFVTARVPTGHTPTSVTVSPDGRWAYVANRLDDSLTVINLAQSNSTTTIDLGGPKTITTERRGEQLFHSARYCFQGQFACATCHPNSHLDGLAWNLETPQLGRDRVANRTLRGIRDTSPYKWNGHNPDLATQCGPRIAKFLFRSEGFNAQELLAVVTYVNNIPLPPNRHLAPDGHLSEAQERGKTIFYRTATNNGREISVENRCHTCHPPNSHFTSRVSTEVGSANAYDTSGLFDVPQLDRVYEDAPYLHNGQALTLEEIWTVYNNRDTHGVTSDMSKEQLNDLIEFLKTL